MDADIVVAGAGHNSLIAACYLAKAGYRCLVLDAREVPGGGSTTEEILLPGYKIDTCATGHTLIRVNPLLTRDELGLSRNYGLRYIDLAVDLDPYLFDGRVGGFMTRVSAAALLNVTAGAGSVVPTFVVEGPA